MNRRKFLGATIKTSISGITLMVAGMLARPGSGFAKHPDTTAHSSYIDQVLTELFGTAVSGEDGGIQIDVPTEAVNQFIVPFRITARNAEKIAVLAERNTEPLIMVLETDNSRPGVVTGTFILERDSEISCFALRQGVLYKNSKYVRLAGKNSQKIWNQPNQNYWSPTSTILKLMPQGDGFDILCSIHRKENAQLFNIENRFKIIDSYIKKVEFKINSTTIAVLNVSKNFSRNPLVGVHVTSLKDNDILSVAWSDSVGRSFTARGTVTDLTENTAYSEQ